MQVTDTTTDKPEVGIQTITVDRPDGAVILAAADAMLTEANAIVIDSPLMYEICHEELVAVKAKWNELDEKEKGLTKPLLAVVAGIRDLFRAPKERLAQAESRRKNAMLAYREECDRIAAEVQRKANALAEEKRQEQLRIAQAATAAAREAEAVGDTGKAVELQEQAEAANVEVAVISAPTYTSAAPRVSGGSVSKTWKCELPQNDSDKLKLLAYIVANPQYLGLVDVSQTACNAQAKAMKQNLAIPGLRAVAVSSMAVRR